MLSVFKAEHAPSMGPTLKLHVVVGGQASCFVAKQAVEFPQV